ncbi:hypothetical protein BNJ_00077 [Kaumoebavirus]|uniref:hypothetical protein n=1 Tax=Kaumoebavirus TaxID=1859492 RepID=UPI0009C3AAB4|nr:hypothetical protein BNJ_00077 [Kaumoebavirus]ARA71918.1 hypothetical protein BNJ_00077 [Kaumoebavirus]
MGARPAPIAPKKEAMEMAASMKAAPTKAREQVFMGFDLSDPTTVNIFILILLFLNFYLMFCVCFGIRKIVKKIKKYGVRTA